MTDLEKSFKEFGVACKNVADSLGKWIAENTDIIMRIFPIVTNNGKKRNGLPMYRRQAIRKAKRNRLGRRWNK